MNAVLEFIHSTFDLNVLALFLISSIILVFIDAKAYKKDGLKKEYKFARFFGYFYLVIGFVLYFTAILIKV